MSEERSLVERKIALKEDAIAFMQMEIWGEVEKAALAAEDLSDKSMGEEHQRHLGAKIGLREFMASVRRMAEYSVPEDQVKRNNYA